MFPLAGQLLMGIEQGSLSYLPSCVCVVTEGHSCRYDAVVPFSGVENGRAEQFMQSLWNPPHSRKELCSPLARKPLAWKLSRASSLWTHGGFTRSFCSESMPCHQWQKTLSLPPDCARGGCGVRCFTKHGPQKCD